MFGLEKYRNIFGRPGKGIHRFRIGNIAIVDVLFTLLLAKFIEIVFFPKGHYLTIVLIIFIVGVFFHLIFNVKTTVQKFLFGGN